MGKDIEITCLYFEAHQYMMKRNLIRGNIRCSSKYQIGNVITVDGFRTIGDSMCKSFCNNKDYCQFISVNNNNECRLYTSCDHSEKSDFSPVVPRIGHKQCVLESRLFSISRESLFLLKSVTHYLFLMV